MEGVAEGEGQADYGEQSDMRPDPRALEIMTWAEVRGQMLNVVGHPGAPVVLSNHYTQCRAWTRDP